MLSDDGGVERSVGLTFPLRREPELGLHVGAQAGLFGTLHMPSCAVVCLGVGLLPGVVLKARPTAARAVTRTRGAMMIVLGALLLVERLAG